MNLESITSHIMNKLPEPPQSAVILGSGLGNFIESLNETICIPFADIKEYPQSTVSGHIGAWFFGYINNKPIICSSGRFHYYEGFTLDEITLPVTVINLLGCQSLIITNAAGCLNKNWQIGDFMFIIGYLDYTFRGNSNPPSIIPITTNSRMLKKVIRTAKDNDLLLREGVYAWALGPSYETPAEIKDIISLGGSAVGMSTVPEIIKANELGLNVMGISCLTNYGAGMEGAILAHEDVLETSSKANKFFSKLLIDIL